MTRAVSTLERTILPAAVIRRGTERAYRGLAFSEGEPHVIRTDLAPVSSDIPRARKRRSIVRFLHLTDAQITDVQSPARVEFLDRHADRRALAPLLPAHRPHEALQLHALEATLRTASDLPSSAITGAPVGLAVSTGDVIDNQQWNELSWFLDLVAGGRVAPDSGGPRFEGVQAQQWDDRAYWHPDGADDVYAARWGFPSYVGLLEQAMLAFQAVGLALPWLACFGNHEGLIQGTSLATPLVQAIATGDRKPIAAPSGFDLEGNVESFVFEPEVFLSGPSRRVTADPGRRLFSRREFVEAHLRASGEPRGHGFTPEHLERGTAYYVYDEVPGVRFVVLDTANPGGFYQGSIGSRQAAWLEERLVEVHSRYVDAQGRTVASEQVDRLVIVCSHHGLETLTNDLAFGPAADADELDLPRLVAPAVRSLLHRFPNVVLWLSGHTHVHRATPRLAPDGLGGFWELSTGAVADWPVQSRIIELVDNGDATLSIFGTLVDHVAPPDPGHAAGLLRLASIHREVAANDPHRGAGSTASGDAWDRNVELVIARDSRPG